MKPLRGSKSCLLKKDVVKDKQGLAPPPHRRADSVEPCAPASSTTAPGKLSHRNQRQQHTT